MDPIKVLGLITARGGSRGLRDKHLLPIAGRAVIEHVCEYVLGEGCDEILLSSDDERILKLGGYYVDTLKRPSYLAKDNTPKTDVVRYIIGQIPSVEWIMLYDGNWVERPPLLDRCRELLTNEMDLIQPVSPIQKEFPQWALLLEDRRIRHYAPDYSAGRQGLREVYYPHTGTLLIKISAFRNYAGDTWPEANKFGFICKPGIDIDNYHDYLLAKAVIESKTSSSSHGPVLPTTTA